MLVAEQDSDQDRREDKDLKRTSIDQTQTEQWNILWRIEGILAQGYIEWCEEGPKR